MPKEREDLTGRKFAKLTVIEVAPSNDRFTHWLCRCECGGSVVARSNNLKTGNTKSCGCLRRRQLPPLRKLDPIVERLSEVRRERNIDVSRLAKKIGYSRQYLGQVESGRHEPSLNFLRCWTQSLGIEIKLEEKDV